MRNAIEFEFREACAEDIPRMKEIRDNVKENALVSLRIEIPDYERALFQDGKGWVCVRDGHVVGFSCGRLKQKDVWALFVDQKHEGQGIGNKLMDILERWMFENGCQEITLSTAPNTRAERLYRHRGWTESRRLPTKEIEFKLKSRV